MKYKLHKIRARYSQLKYLQNLSWNGVSKDWVADLHDKVSKQPSRILEMRLNPTARYKIGGSLSISRIYEFQIGSFIISFGNMQIDDKTFRRSEHSNGLVRLSV